MLQNPFYEGMQRKTKTIIKSDFKETYHPGHGNYIKGQDIRGPYSDTKGRSVVFSKGNLIRRTDLARSHSYSVLDGGFEVF